MASKTKKQKYITRILCVLTYTIVIFSFYPFLWFVPQSLGFTYGDNPIIIQTISDYFWLNWWYGFPTLILFSWFLFNISKIRNIPKIYLHLLHFAATILIIGVILATLSSSGSFFGPLVVIYFIPSLLAVFPSLIDMRKPAFQNRFK